MFLCSKTSPTFKFLQIQFFHNIPMCGFKHVIQKLTEETDIPSSIYLPPPPPPPPLEYIMT